MTALAQQVVKLSETERQAFTDVYRFYERHHAMPNTTEAWEQCYADVKEISDRYEGSGKALVCSLLTALYGAIDQRCRDEAKEH